MSYKFQVKNINDTFKVGIITLPFNQLVNSQGYEHFFNDIVKKIL